MNGNFEYDRGAYPYGTLSTGHGVKIVYIPNLTELYKHTVPKEVGTSVAQELNAYHHGKAKAKELADAKAGIAALVKTHARKLLDEGVITSATYNQVAEQSSKG